MNLIQNKINCAFETDPDPNFFYESSQHSEAISRLLYISSDRGVNIGVLTGEIGSGKTLLCKLYARSVGYSSRIVYIPSSNIPYEAILDTIIYQLSGVRKAKECNMDRYLLHNEYEKILNDYISSTGSHLIIILDECQMISTECLKNLKCLTNTQGQSSKVSLIFCGQPEFNQTLNQCPTVAQRVGLMYFLPYLKEEDIAPYISLRLNQIGKKSIIDDNAIGMIYRFSRGCPRDINKICKIAFEYMDKVETLNFSSQLIEMVINDIQQQKLCMPIQAF
ncbi:AAA family ATPase [Lentisphaera marina]|uniref:ExeA family protein n=1 Tax=Lentisphaera marina TaxID=1111041 RepID=UPI0023667835|nr:AAA family ATPase [Lentisphaera marina]MDD7987231.1 AAA family ATPase [Lentisphaera marina]